MMKRITTEKLLFELEVKIIETLLELKLKPNVSLKNNECHFITLINNYPKTITLYNSQFFKRSPVKSKSAYEFLHKGLETLRSDESGRRVYADKSLINFEIYDSPLFPLN